jgi:hypothetical protein
MKDMKERLEKLQKDAAECALIRDLATDPAKRELFTRLAEHYRILATEVERAIKTFGSGATPFLGRKTYEPFPKEETRSPARV